MNPGQKMRLLLILLWTAAWVAAADQVTQIQTNRVDFGIFWPPRFPSEANSVGVKPLLDGSLLVRSEHLPDHRLVSHLLVRLSRASDEAGREFWNSRLAFSEYDWMRYVRVWDKQNQWLWPNLPYLLRLHGVERVERYGGVDPAKGVDNDFAAVLIRKYDDAGEREDPLTERRPLVAAEWYPVNATGEVDKQTIVHVVQSDEFTVHLGGADRSPRGMIAVWLIYADFMGASVPQAWPKAAEFAGGVLAYFELHWDLKAARGKELKIQLLVPRRGTGFDWEQWTTRTRAARDSKSTAVLVDTDAAGANAITREPGKVQPSTATDAAPLPGERHVNDNR